MAPSFETTAGIPEKNSAPSEGKDLVFSIGDSVVPVEAFSRGNSDLEAAASEEMLRGSELRQAAAMAEAIRENRPVEGIPAESVHESVGMPIEARSGSVDDSASPSDPVEADPAMEEVRQRVLDELGVIDLRKEPSSPEEESASTEQEPSLVAAARTRIAEVWGALKGVFSVESGKEEMDAGGMFLELRPEAKHVVAGFALTVLIAGIPAKDAEAGAFYGSGSSSQRGNDASWGSIIKAGVLSTIGTQAKAAEQRQREQQREARKQEAEAKKYEARMERAKKDYARDSKKEVDGYYKDVASIEKDYSRERSRLSKKNVKKDDGSSEAALREAEISYHKSMLRAADEAWQSIRRVEEKNVYLGQTGGPYQSQENQKFLGHLQKVALDELAALKSLGENAVTIIPPATTEQAAPSAGGADSSPERVLTPNGASPAQEEREKSAQPQERSTSSDDHLKQWDTPDYRF